MNNCITVYFDTNFYVWLANATDKDANEIVLELNKLKVRHVLSGQVILELLSNSNKSEKDEILVNRMSKFEIEPYRISSSILEALSLFVTHQNEIDLLQIDSAQKNQIYKKGKVVHRLVELALNNRCFSANSLKNTVEAIKEKKQELSL